MNILHSIGIIIVLGLCSLNGSVTTDKIIWWPLKPGVYGDFLVSEFNGSLWITSELMKGSRLHEKSITAFHNALQVEDETKTEQLKKELPRYYKIHCMPKDKDMAYIIETLIKSLQTDKELQALINKIKVVHKVSSTNDNNILPRIVIYPPVGKAQTQQLLDKLYKLFKSKKGLDIAPRYNARVTSLLYVAQGDGDDKLKEQYDIYYETPSKVYYSKKYFIPDADTEHYLRSPKSGKWLLK